MSLPAGSPSRRPTQPLDSFAVSVMTKAVMLIAGARPNFMKLAPVLRAVRARGLESIVVHTGQHYDAAMSGAFFSDLRLEPPDYSLAVGSASHAKQTARVMEAFEPVLTEVAPNWIVVFGDVNSTLACALVAAKLRPELGCRVAHVEAGLRSGDWRMPEEINRVLADRLSDLLFTPSRDARMNLLREGIDDAAICFVGNVMIDTLLDSLPRARALAMPQRLAVQANPYVVATLHRPSNVDDRAALCTVIGGLRKVAAQVPVILPLHPRTRKNIEDFGLHDELAPLHVTEPLSYLEMLGVVDGAAAVVTDSGGLQEETTVLGVPCVTLREHTERPITVSHGTNRMAHWPPTSHTILQDTLDALARGRAAVSSRSPEGWDGRASERIASALEA